MKSVKNAGFYVLRKPLLSIDALFRFFQATAQSPSIEAELREAFEHPLLQEAIYLASADLFSRLQEWLRGEISAPNKEKLFKSLFKYFSRACVRCTPFGMFAGCITAGHIGSETRISLPTEHSYVKHTRLDTNYLADVVQYIVSQPDVRCQLTYLPNNSLYLMGDEYRYTFYSIQNKARSYSVCSVKVSPYLQKVLKEAEKGLTIQQLATLLLSDEIAYEDAEAFVLELIHEQLLVSEIQLTITGPDFLRVLIAHLSSLTNTDGYVTKLREIQDLLRLQDCKVSKYLKIGELIQQNFVRLDTKDVVQTDIFFSASPNTIGKDVINSLTQTFEKLLVLNQGHYNAHLENFRKNFYERYEEQEVPLLVALDNEVGIGYGDHLSNYSGYLPLIDSLSLAPKKNDTLLEWNIWKDFVLRKYSEGLFQNRHEIVLTDEDLNFLSQHSTSANQDLTGFFSAFGNLIATSEKALDQGDFLFNLYNLSGPSATNLLSRFCYGDAALLANVERCIQEEEACYPDAIIAEIVHLPQERIGNILMRPAFRKYEIPYLAKSAVTKEFQLPLSDLMLSIRGGKEIVLRSVKHNKRVIPRLTTAHNFSKGLSIYKFLCDLQFETQVPNVLWHWAFLEKQCFLPRVRYKNVIVSRATWTLSIEAYPELKDKKTDTYGFFKKVKDTLRIPQYVSITESDHELLIDFENIHCLEILKEIFIKKELISIKEHLQVPDACFLHDSAGRYTNEIIIPCYKVRGPVQREIHPSLAHSLKRNFSMGSEWLYMKVYTGEKTADTLLKGMLKDISEELADKGIIDKWFFVRYSDPHHHIRIRFHGNPENKFYKETLQKVHDKLGHYLEKGLIYKLQTDIYKRELERYGSDTITLSEDLFFYDSEAVCKLISLLDSDLNEKYRWLFAFYGIDALLNDFQYTLEGRQKLTEGLNQQYLKEFDIKGELKEQLNEQYRKDVKEIEHFMDLALNNYPEKEKVRAIFNCRSEKNRAVVEQIVVRIAGDTKRVNQLVISYMHMFLNRLFMSNQRLHELAIYHYLNKYYRSSIGKRKALEKASLS